MAAPSIEDIYELSPLQSGMLFHTLYAPESRLYFEQVLVPLEGEIDRTALKCAWEAVIAANPTLRTSFHWEEIDKPVQVVHRTAELCLLYRDLRNFRESRQAGEIAAFCEVDRQNGFDMGKAPLLRIGLIQLSSKSYRLLLSFHHAILDGWSLQRAYRQFAECYPALVRGERPELAACRAYKDYIKWLQAQDLRAAERYWRKTLADRDAGARLLLHPARDVDEYAAREVSLSTETSTALRQFAQRHMLTLNTLVQAAWALLLSRLTGCDDVVFGAVVSGRPSDLEGVDEMLGLFINTLPVRVCLPREGKVLAWLKALQADQFAARQYDFTPLIQIQTWAGVRNGEALFDTIVAFENYPMQVSTERNGPKATLIERTNYPLSVIVMPGERIILRLLYNRRFLSDRATDRISEQYVAMLESLTTASGGLRIDELDPLSDADLAALHALNDSRSEYLKAAIPDLFDRQAAAWPDAVALEFGGRALTYGELARYSHQMAQRLIRMGVRRGDRVSLMLGRSAEMVVAMLGTLRAGAAYVPIDLAYPAARIEDILVDTGTKVTITSPALGSRLAGIRTEVIRLDVDFRGLRGEAEPAPSVLIEPADDAYVMFTSGSTGRPKGVMIPHRAIARLVQNTAYARIAPTDKVGHGSNCAFDAATFEIWGALLNGATLVGLDSEVMLSSSALAQAIAERGVTVLFVTTALFNEIVAARPDTFRSLRVLLFGGELVDPHRVRQVLHTAPPELFCHVYGPTEVTTFATWHQISHNDLIGGTIPIGRPINNTVAFILDANMRAVSPGQVGELYLGGDGLAHGYLGNPRLTAESFVPAPFSDSRGARLYRTGDKVRWREDGSIEFLGRFDDQIKVRGHRVELGEIEFWLRSQPCLRQAIACVRLDPSGEKRIVAYVVADAPTAIDITGPVQEALRKRLPPYMQPHVIVVLPDLPLSANGKVDRRALPDPAWSSSHPGGGFSESRTEVEERLTALWREVLGLERIGIHDNFFDLGGHSLRATQLVSRIRREFGVEMPLRAVFERTTIAEQAALLETSATGPTITPMPEIKRVARVPR
jgi:amino acid adenylation domain-containing protein